MTRRLEVASCLGLLAVSTACIYSPADGSTLAEGARVDGSPPPVDVWGGASSPGGVTRLEAWNWTRGSWDPIAEAVARDSFLDPGNSIYGWKIEDLKVRNLEHVTTDAATGKQHVRLRGRSDLDGTAATFDASGLQCLYDQIGDDVPAFAAGQGCTTGNDLDLYFTAYAGGSLPSVTFDDVHGCSAGRALNPTPAEAGHRYAQRVTPPGYPFTVDQIRYNLLHDIQPGGENEGCRADQPHAVELFVVPHGEGPSADPIEVFRLPRNLATPSSDLTVVPAVLPVSLTIEEGEDLFIAFEMPREADDDRLCLSSCFDPANHVDTNHYWSNSASAPYPWVTLASFGPGVDMNPQVRITGRVGS